MFARFSLSSEAPLHYNYKCVGEYIDNRPHGNIRLAPNSTTPNCVGKIGKIFYHT